MRLPLLVSVLFVMLFAAPALGLGYGEPVPPGEYCPTYDVDTGEGDARVQASTTSRPHGALVLTADRYSFVEDTFYVNSIGEPYLFSLWIYEESNGLPGLQRGDPVCDSTPAGHDADTIVN